MYLILEKTNSHLKVKSSSYYIEQVRKYRKEKYDNLEITFVLHLQLPLGDMCGRDDWRVTWVFQH